MNSIAEHPSASQKQSPAVQRLWAVVHREPLVHFLVLAALLFALDQVFASAQKERIVVDRQAVAFLIKQREDLELRTLSPSERAQTLAAFVEDEILYSEAYKRGLDKGDSRMRRNLILKMRGLLGGDVRNPTEQDLIRHFQANRAKFVNPATVSLERIFFADPSRVPRNLLEDLRAGRTPTTVGESRIGLERALPRLSQRRMVLLFGPNATRAILAIRDDRWHGPFESTRGAHFVRIVGREPAAEARFEDVKRYLEGDWMLAQSRKAIEREVERIRDNYEIVIEDGDTVGP